MDRKNKGIEDGIIKTYDYYKKYNLPVIDKEHNYDKIMDDLEHGITPDMQRYELPVS